MVVYAAVLGVLAIYKKISTNVGGSQSRKFVNYHKWNIAC